MKAGILTLLSLVATSALVQAGPLGKFDAFDQLRIFKDQKPAKRLIQYSEDSPAKWMEQSDIDNLFRAGIKFMDITDHQDLDLIASLNQALSLDNNVIPTSVKYQDEIKPIIGNLTTETMEENLKKFTSFRTRYYKSKSGGESGDWLFNKIKEISNGADHITVRQVTHNWVQKSIVARFEGSDSSLSNEVAIVGAHQDSVNMWLPTWGRSPGADDDGSGTVTILEAFRSLVQNNFKPERPVEFHWYSAEEAGLLGSQDIASAYQSKGTKVVAMLQNDMTGYIGDNGEVIGVVTDHVDEKLTGFLKTVIDNYADIPYRETKCGYACSDHASWRKAGFASAFTIESAFEDSNQHIHTSGDTIDKLSFDHMLEFAKVASAFAVELSHK